jgi:hypothetical protein
MHAFVPAVVSRLGSANQPVLFELLGQPEARPWGPWVEVSPETAEMIGVTNGDPAVVESESGAVDVSVVVVEGMTPGVVALALVPAVPTGGRWARAVRRDLRSLASDAALRAGRVPVRVRKV